MTRPEFVERMSNACKVARQKGAQFNEPVVFAQAALESNWGSSGLCARANNLFGIKAGKCWSGQTLELPTREWSKAKGWYDTVAKWRVYPSWNECIVDYSRLLSRLSWYHDALSVTHDPSRFLSAILPSDGEPGWATDPKYAQKIWNVVREIEKLGGPKWEVER
ncbi:MAG: glucosaminidase domain-containing protein [Clostridia bacterium]|nr:glucosaminidase domain-containing protein [Clostridia bacterium]